MVFFRFLPVFSTVTSTRSSILKSAPTRLAKALADTLAGRRASHWPRIFCVCLVYIRHLQVVP